MVMYERKDPQHQSPLREPNTDNQHGDVGRCFNRKNMNEIGIDGYTTPALAVSTATDSYTVAAANEVFQSYSDGDPTGESLIQVGDQWMSGIDGTGLRAAINDEQNEFVEFPGVDGRYLPQTVRESPTGCHLLFVRVPIQDPVPHPEAVAHVVSHDLRNPLDVAKAHLQASRDEQDDEHLEMVAQAHDRMEEIIQDVLTLARGENALSPSNGVDLGEVVADACAGVATNDLELVFDEPLPTVSTDRPRVERLVENLFRNTVDHAGDQSTVHVGPLHNDTGFYVADDGDGVPADRREAVFDPGFTTADSGAGLGLTIVRRIANAHGWSVQLTKSQYGGTRVEIWFGEGGAP